jgi:hypothetical protein
MVIRYTPIGIVHSPFSALEGMPIQPAGAAGIKGTVEVFPEYQDGLKDLEGFSHIILLYHFHRSTDSSSKWSLSWTQNSGESLPPEHPSVRTLSVYRLSSSGRQKTTSCILRMSTFSMARRCWTSSRTSRNLMSRHPSEQVGLNGRKGLFSNAGPISDSHRTSSSRWSRRRKRDPPLSRCR